MKYTPVFLQAYDPTAPLPLPAVRKRTTVLKKLTTQEIEFLQDPDEDFVPSESDDDDDDESYLPEHDRRPYNRNNHLNGSINRGETSSKVDLPKKNFFQGRGRGGRGHAISATNRLPPSTHFVRPQPETASHGSTSVKNHRANPLEVELQRSYATTLPRFYGTRNGQSTSSADYGDFRISM